MKKAAVLLMAEFLITGCAYKPSERVSDETSSETETVYAGLSEDQLVTVGKKKDCGMIVDNTYHDPERGDIHFSSYVPDTYDGKKPYALFVTNPGWKGEYQQGIGKNLTEPFPYEAMKYNKQMIILSPQLNGWNEDNARDSLALTHHFLSQYNIDPDHVYLHGHSGGGETVSWELNLEPGLFKRVLITSSQFDGNTDALVQSETPLYLAIVRNDAWYTEKPFQHTFQEIHDAYVKEEKTEDEIRHLLVLDIRNSDFGKNYGVNNTHGAGEIFAFDQKAMKWLFESK